ncbi:MAG: hypothetical protein KGL39_50265 [Patescibacteria group bacterium]|nr:hypothetical protein [Patescibacteria group bacterium]
MAKTGRGKEKNAAKALADNAKVMADKAQAESLVLTPASVLKALLNDDGNYKEQIDGLVGELREQIKNAIDKKHLHKKAYADVKRFFRYKSSEELRRHWLTLLAYMDMSGVMKRIESVPDLPLDGEKAEGEEVEAVSDEAEETTSEVVKPQFGGRRQRAAEPVH